MSGGTWPVPVFGIILAACVGTAIWGSYRTIDGLALLFALYTVAALRPLRQALACAGVLAVVASSRSPWRVGGSSWWYDAILVCGLYGAGLGLGLYSGTRRAYLAELHRPRGPAGARAGPAGRAGRRGRAGPDRAGDARHRGPQPDRDGDAERGGHRGRGQLAGAGRRGHAQPVGHRAARAGRHPPPPGRAAPGPRRGPAARCRGWPSSTGSSSRSGRPGWTPRWRSPGRCPTCPRGCSSPCTGWSRRP